MAEKAVHLHGTRLGPVPGRDGARIGQQRAFRACAIRRQVDQRRPCPRAHGGAAANHALTQLHQPLGRRQIQALVAAATQISVAQRIPTSEQTGTGIPGLGAGGEGLQAKIGVKGMAFDVGRVVALATGFHRRQIRAAVQHIDAIGIQQGEVGVQMMGTGKLGSQPDGGPHEHREQQQCGPPEEYHGSFLPPHSMGSPG